VAVLLFFCIALGTSFPSAYNYFIIISSYSCLVVLVVLVNLKMCKQYHEIVKRSYKRSGAINCLLIIVFVSALSC
jgi:Kef-type K+ transport system membrane component KefB